MRIFLIRHGRQSDTRCNVDVDLAEEGKRQADLVGRRMQVWGVDRLVSSNLIRARQTAEIMNAHLRLPHEVEPDLKELDFGEMEGLDDDQIADRFAGFKRRQQRMDLDLRYPGGESASDLLERVVPALRRIADGPGSAVACVTHGVVIRGLVCYATRSPLARWHALAHRLENSSITELVWRPDLDEFTLERLNDHAHLEAHPSLLRAAWGVREN